MTPQIRELIIAYAITATAMLIGLLFMRAQPRAYWRWPVYSVMAMVLGVVKWNLLRKYVLPAEWVFTHANVLYYGALAVYALVGVAFGLLLGRLTRGSRDTPETSSGPIS
jgi:hypothetical protein